jgi:hypothetical protein
LELKKKIKENYPHPCRQNEKITKNNEKRMKEDEQGSAPLYSYCERRRTHHKGQRAPNLCAITIEKTTRSIVAHVF